jgi:hypothetical protein
VDAIAHAARRNGEQASQLTAAEHAERGTWRDDARHGSCSCRTFCVCSSRNAFSWARRIRTSVGEDGDGEQPGIGRPRLADGQRRHRHAARHLHDRQQRVEPLQGGTLHRHAKHRHHRVRRHHARQVRRAAGAGDDHLDAALLRAGGEFGHPHRRAVRRHDVPLVRHAEPLQHVTACCIVSQSDVEPMTTATRGLGESDIWKLEILSTRPTKTEQRFTGGTKITEDERSGGRSIGRTLFAAFRGPCGKEK